MICSSPTARLVNHCFTTRTSRASHTARSIYTLKLSYDSQLANHSISRHVRLVEVVRKKEDSIMRVVSCSSCMLENLLLTCCMVFRFPFTFQILVFLCCFTFYLNLKMTSEGLKRRSFLSLIFITKIFTKGTSRDARKSFAFGCQCQNYDETESGTWKHFFSEVAFAVAVVVFLNSRSPQPRKQSLFLLTTGWETSDPGKSLLEDRAQESIIDQV